MSRWVLRGIKTGIVTTCYPEKKDNSSGVSSGFFLNGNEDSCNFGVFDNGNNYFEKCIQCFRCKNNAEFTNDYEKVILLNKNAIFPENFKNSIHIRVFDAGDCGACINEIKLLNNPFYNMHRLGFFITPTPRKADLLIISGVLTEHMKFPLIKTFEAMPSPKRVILIGTCASGNGIFKDSFMTLNKITDIVPVDMIIPGCPPSPLNILYGLMVISGKMKIKVEEK